MSKGEAKEEASVYKYQSGDCILQEVMACYCIAPPQPGLALMGKSGLVMGVYSPVGRCGENFLHWLWLICWERARQFYLSAWRNIPVFQSWSAGDMSRIFQMYFICIRGEILTGLN